MADVATEGDALVDGAPRVLRKRGAGFRIEECGGERRERS
jgi:predicted metalloprotease